MHMPAFRRQWTVDDLQDLPDDGQRYPLVIDVVAYFAEVLEG